MRPRHYFVGRPGLDPFSGSVGGWRLMSFGKLGLLRKVRAEAPSPPAGLELPHTVGAIHDLKQLVFSTRYEDLYLMARTLVIRSPLQRCKSIVTGILVPAVDRICVERLDLESERIWRPA